MRHRYHRLTLLLLSALFGISLLTGSPGYAQAPSAPVEFDVQAQDLASALRAFLEQTNLPVVYSPSSVAGLQSPGVSGSHDPIEALRLLTAGTGLVVEQTSAGTVTIRLPEETGSLEVAEAPFVSQSAELIGEQITVTATRRAKALDDLPVSVTVLSALELDARVARDVTEVANWLPAVQLTAVGQYVRQFVIRGITNTGGTGGTPVDVFFDSATIDFEGSELFPLLLDTERVEVLKGPQGTLYGESSLAGIVRYISVRPVLNEWQGNIVGRSWDTDGGDSSSAGTAVLNIPLVTDTLAARLAYGYEDRGGFINVYTVDPGTLAPDQLISEDANPVDQEAWRAAIEWRPSERVGVYLTARHQTTEILWEANEAMSRIPSGGDNLEPAGDFISTTNAVEWLRPLELEADWATLEATFELSGATLISESTWVQRDNAVVSRLASPPDAIFDFIDEQTNLSQEFRLVSPDDDRFEWIVGAYWRDKDFSSNGVFDLPAFDVVSTFGQDVRRTQTAVFGNIMYRLAQRWSAELGLRLFREDVDQARSSGGESGGEPLPTDVQSGSDSFDVAAPRFVLSFDAGDNTLLYGSIAKGFRGGSTNTGENVPDDLRDTDPDTNYAYELGIKGHWFDGALSGSAAAFYNDWDDIPVLVLRDIDGTTVQLRPNGDSANTYGVEVDLNWRVSDTFTLSLLAHYLETEIDGTIREGLIGPSALPVEEGNELPEAPTYSVALAGNLVLPLTSEWDGYLRADVLARDGSYSLESNSPISESDSYELGNLRIGARSDNWDISLFVHNIWDERAHHGHSANFISPDVGSADIAEAPRRIGLTVGYRF